MVIFNLVGGLWLLIGFGLVAALQSMSVNSVQGLGLGVLFFITVGILDALYRILIVRRKLIGYQADASFKSRVFGVWLISPLGGSVFFLPAWSFAVLCPLWLVYVVGVKNL